MSEIDEEFSADLPLADAIDNAILMHRDAHFGGKFDVMIRYYESEGRGMMQEFELSRIRELEALEKMMGGNLASTLLSGAEAERISEAKEAYRRLRSLYEESNKSTLKKYPKLIADLILAEEEELEQAVEHIVAEKGAIVPALIELLRSDDFHNPLFPGYGQAPALAARCLALIGDKRAIIALFESLGSSDFMSDEFALHALKLIGDPAKEFLLKVLHSQPLTFDNERAAMALISFKDDPEVVKTCFGMLKGLDFKKNFVLATDLILVCEELKDPAVKKEFLEISKLPTTPSMLQQDMKAISKLWE